MNSTSIANKFIFEIQERYERLQFQHRVYRQFLKIADESWKMVGALKSPEQVHLGAGVDTDWRPDGPAAPSGQQRICPSLFGGATFGGCSYEKTKNK